jgi:hypothetical protein
MSCVDGWFFSCADTKLNFPRDQRIGDVVGNGCFGRKWFDEADWAGDDFGFFAESGEKLKYPRRRNVFEFASSKFFAEAAFLVGNSLNQIFASKFAASGESFEVESLEVPQPVLMFATPGDEGWFCDLEFIGNTCEGPPLGTEFDESFYNLVVQHKFIS